MHKIKHQSQNEKILTNRKEWQFRRFKLALSQMQLKNFNNILTKCRITELS